MLKSLIVISLLIAPAVWAKSSSAQSLQQKRNLLKKISCVYSGKLTSGTTANQEPIDFPDPENTICDPLSDGTSGSPEKGLLGQLILRTPEMGTTVKGVMDYYNKGQRLETKLYFADVNVPTRPFTQGFTTQSGSVLVDAEGNKLVEHFSIEYDSILRLAEGDPEGTYEISILSDDGARLFVKENGFWSELINNDGNHPTRLGCSYRTIELKKDSEIPIKLLYYQGPRYHIANVLLWKHHAKNNLKGKKAKFFSRANHRVLCGKQNSNLYYNSKNSNKQIGLMILEKQGWKTISANNFKMPPATKNYCAVPELQITDYKIVSSSGSEAELSWVTNFPASSRLRIVNVFTNEEYYTRLDSTLVTEHNAKLSGLIPGLQYQIQAISVDASGKEIRSEPLLLAP